MSQDDWTVENLDKVSHEFILANQYKPKEAFMTVRIAITGEKATPPLFDTLATLGKDVSLDRLRSAELKAKKVQSAETI